MVENPCEQCCLGIFTLKMGKFSVCIFVFLEWDLRVIYSSDIFGKDLDHPPWGFKIPKLILGLFCFVFHPPPPIREFFTNFYVL